MYTNIYKVQQDYHNYSVSTRQSSFSSMSPSQVTTPGKTNGRVIRHSIGQLRNLSEIIELFHMDDTFN